MATNSKTDPDPDRDWMVLSLDLTDLPGLLSFRDLFSDCGVILSGVDHIPPDRISVEWQPALTP